MFAIEQKVGDAVRKAGIVSASAVLASVGIAFLTVAAWIYLVELDSALFAATIIGLVYLGLGGLLLAIGLAGRSPRRPVAPPAHAMQPPTELTPAQLVVVSFMQGLEQGRKTKKSL